MAKFATIEDLKKENYPMRWINRIVHSEDFVAAGGRREPGKGTKIFFDVAELDRYLKKQTEIGGNT